MSKLLKESADTWADANGKPWDEYDIIHCPDGTVIDMENLLDEQYRAEASLVHLAPFLGGFVSKLRFIYTFAVSTQATDGFNILVNPQFTASLDFTGKVFVMAHEVCHCLLNHLRRTEESHDPYLSNIAADYEVNDMLVAIGLFKPATITKLGGLWDPKYNDWGYEKIYANVTRLTGLGTMDNTTGVKQAGGSGGYSEVPGFPDLDASDDYRAGWEAAMEELQ